MVSISMKCSSAKRIKRRKIINPLPHNVIIDGTQLCLGG